VNSWVEDENSRKVTYQDTFMDITPNAFTLDSAGTSGGTTVWHVITRYARAK